MEVEKPEKDDDDLNWTIFTILFSLCSAGKEC